MQINLKILKQKIDEYYNKTISKDDLGKWASKGYYALMKGEYIEIEKLEIYHFVRTISTFHIKKEPHIYLLYYVKDYEKNT